MLCNRVIIGDLVRTTCNGTPYYRKGDIGHVTSTLFDTVCVDLTGNKKVFRSGIFNINRNNIEKLVYKKPQYYFPV